MIEFEAIVKKILYKNDSNYHIALVQLEKEFDYSTIKGYCDIQLDQSYTFKAKVEDDPKYGEFYQISYFEKIIPTKEKEIINYLSSSMFEGIGKMTALKIYNCFLEDTISILSNNPHRIDEVDVSDVVKEEIISKLKNTDLLRDLYTILIPLGLSEFLINEIYRLLQVYDDALSVIKNNPYELIEFKETAAYTFKVADQIYLNFNQELKNFNRISSAIKYYFLTFCYNNGDTKLEIENFAEKLVNLIDVDLDTILSVLSKLNDENELISFKEYFQIKSFYLTEKKIADNILYRQQYFKSDNDFEYKKDIERVEKEFNIKFSTLQKKAIAKGITANFSIITGGPGTGKTTIIRAILKLIIEKKYGSLTKEQTQEKIALIAPTGRAAQRMKETTSFQAKTIHSLLKWDHYSKTFFYNKENPISFDIIIIDEFSMVDIFLYKDLIEAIRPETKIIILGDPNQLESVGPGSVLRDIIESKQVDITTLDFVYRQQKGSSINELAHNICDDKKIEIVSNEEMSIIHGEGNLLNIIKRSVELSHIKGYEEMDVQVLYPRYRGMVGIDKLNEVLRPTENSDSMIYRDIKYCVGDKIMQLKNDYDKDIYNGDIGNIIRIYRKNGKGKEVAIQAEFRDVILDLTFKELENITHAYAISIHKAQGSEFKVIILPVGNERHILTKKLIYTAVTRAKEKLIIIGNIDRINQGINENDYQRKTNLRKLLGS